MRKLIVAGVAALVIAMGGSGIAIADDADDVKATISAQLEAFKSGDAEAAYSHAAPGIQTLFPDAERFMAMVEGGYGPVYASSTATFGPMTEVGELFQQEVYLSDPQGQSWVARYILQRQPDGSMKIAAVQMRRGDDIAT